MGVSYNGINLLLEDSDGEAQEALEMFLPTEDGRMISDWNFPLKTENFAGTSAACYTGQSLPTLNYSKPQRVKINTWYQPVGASRWSYGFFLADSARLRQIQALIPAGSTTGFPLVLQSLASGKNTASTRTFNAYMLPCHAISADVNNSASLWLIPLVDERYFWQFYEGNNVVIDGTANTFPTWDDFFTRISPAVPRPGTATISHDAVPSAYIRPNYFFLAGAGNYVQTPLWIDLMLHSIGQRLVPNYAAPAASTTFPGYSWKSMNFSSSQNRLVQNLAGVFDQGFLQAGSTSIPGFSTLTPQSISVCFRGWSNGIVLPDWLQTRYVSTNTPANGTVGYFKNINSTALADYSAGGAPANQATLDALALQISTDFIASISWVQDSIILGISQWQESGYDDFVEFDVGYRDPISGEYVCQTRIHTIPYNFSSDNMFHYDSSTWEYGDKIYGTLDGALTANGNQTITLTGADGPIPSGTTHIKVYDVLGNAISAGVKIYALRMGSKWVADTGDVSSTPGLNQLIVATVAAVTQAGSTANFTSINTAAVYSTLVRDGLCIPAKDYIIAPTDGGGYEVVNPERIIYGQFTSTNEAVGNTDNFTLFTGAVGAETTTGVTVSGYIRYAGCQKNRTYMAVYSLSTSFGGAVWEIINGEGFFVAQYSSGTIFAPASPTMTLKTGTLGSEASGFTNPTVTALLRWGMIHTGKLYKIGVMNNGYEILDPDMEFLGKVETTNWAINTSRTQTMYDGTLGAETASGVGITNCYNRLQLIVVGKWIRLAFCRDNGGWDICTFQP